MIHDVPPHVYLHTIGPRFSTSTWFVVFQIVVYPKSIKTSLINHVRSPMNFQYLKKIRLKKKNVKISVAEIPGCVFHSPGTNAGQQGFYLLVFVDVS